MSDYFDLLEAELRAAVPRVAPGAGRRRRPLRVRVPGSAGARRAPLRALVPALAIGVALAVAAAAVVLLGHARRPAPATPAPAHQPAGSSRPYPTLAQLVANFAVLRRAQTAADRSWRQAARADGPLLARYTRQAVRLFDGTRVFLAVSREQGFSGQPSGSVLLMITIVDPDGNASSTNFGPNVNYTVIPLSDGTLRRRPSQGRTVWAAIVPDGVSRVSWTFGCAPRVRACPAPQRRTVAVGVQGNVAATILPGNTGLCDGCLGPISATWYAPDGHALGTFGRQTFNLTVPPFIADGHAIIRSSKHLGAAAPLRDLLRGDGIGMVRFGTPRARTTRLLTTLAGLHAKPLSTLAECGVDSALRWRAPGGLVLDAYFDRGRFVGYQYGTDRAAQRAQLRAPGLRLATAVRLALGDTLSQGRRLYGSRFVISAAQGGSWSASTPAGRVDGYSLVLPGKPILDPANLVASIDGGDVGCPALSP